MQSVLMIAYHYPPEGSSSGIQRTLKFSQYLGDHGWHPVVLSANPRAYRVRRDDQLGDIPTTTHVRRAFALDTARHLSFSGRYLGLTALPDRWVSWWLGAVPAGLSLIRKHRPRVLWSTYPIATAHLIGLTLQRLSGIPWVADFRDSMTETDYPPDARQRRVYRWIERGAMNHCARAVFTTRGALKLYSGRYPTVERKRFALIPNGYDEENFREAAGAIPTVRALTEPTQTVLLHSGALYPSERDPRCFYEAVASLLRDRAIEPRTFRVILRASGYADYHRGLIQEHGIEEIVSLEPALPYREALREMMDVDGLLIFQASNCNHQIPAKIYEYLRARRPILALADPRGNTAQALREAGLDCVEPLDDANRIAKGLLEFVTEIRQGRAKVASEHEVTKHSRRARTAALARLLDEVASEGDVR